MTEYQKNIEKRNKEIVLGYIEAIKAKKGQKWE